MRVDPALFMMGLSAKKIVSPPAPSNEYANKVLGYSPSQYLKMNELSDLVATDSSGNNLDGVYNDVVLDSLNAPVDNDRAGLLNGTTSYVDIFSAGLSAVFSAATTGWTASLWVYMDQADWLSASVYCFLEYSYSAGEYIQLYKSAADTIALAWRRGATFRGTQYILPSTPSGWINLTAKAFGSATLYYQGVSVGVASNVFLTGAALANANLGRLVSGANYMPGSISHYSGFNSPLDDATILDLAAS